MDALVVEYSRVAGYVAVDEEQRFVQSNKLIELIPRIMTIIIVTSFHE